MSEASTTTPARNGPGLSTFLRLGRVSNVPTVWSNVLLGTVLGGGAILSGNTALVLAAMTLFYVGGMYLNDWFDRDIDAQQRSTRPIPAGEIGANTVAAIGFAMLAIAIVLMFATGIRGIAANVAIVGLPASILLYNWWHKGNVYSPLLMGMCRALVVIGAAAVAAWPAPKAPQAALQVAPLVLFYVAGLTYAAKQESLDRIGNLWPLVLLAAPLAAAWPALLAGVPGVLVLAALTGWTAYCVWLLARRPMPGAVPRAVVSLIAGIALVDAAILMALGASMVAFVAVVFFLLTLALQRLVPGT
jgi:4-hydroxybenzoate polyprenyltransferase